MPVSSGVQIFKNPPINMSQKSQSSTLDHKGPSGWYESGHTGFLSHGTQWVRLIPRTHRPFNVLFCSTAGFVCMVC